MKFLERQAGFPDLRILEIELGEQNQILRQIFLARKIIEFEGQTYMVRGDSTATERNTRTLFLISRGTARGLREVSD